MSTEGISFTIVENAVSEELPSGDLKKAGKKVESEDKRRQSGGVH